jgi:hypothetical protein
MLFAFSMPLWINHMVTELSLDSLLHFSYIFFVGWFGVMILAPEILTPGGGTAKIGIGNDFLITRAVDKSLICRAKSMLFYGLVVIVPFSTLLLAARQPDLRLFEYSKISRIDILSHFPNAIQTGDPRSHHLLIPFGQVWVAVWGIMVFLTTASVTQLIIWLIYRFRYRRSLLIICMFTFILLPLVRIFSHGAGLKGDQLSLNETFFLAFVSHPILYGVLLVIALITGQLWCERRFVRLEF